MTLNELQTLSGNTNWIQPFLKIPSDSLKPVFELLKADTQFNSLRKLTPEAQQATQLFETTPQHSFINRIDPSQPLKLLIWYTPTTPTGATIQWPNKMIEMLFSHNTLPRNYYSLYTRGNMSNYEGKAKMQTIVWQWSIILSYSFHQHSSRLSLSTILFIANCN
jgi:hypothetical protein